MVQLCPVYDWYCPACDEAYYDLVIQAWQCPFTQEERNAVREVAVLETEPVYSEVKNE